jgi:flagellar biosynthesis protein
MSKSDRNKQPQAEVREAVALAYDPAEEGLPQVTAKGKGELAETLVDLALRHGIPIKYDPDLVNVLSQLEEGQDIPDELFLVVAELLAFIYRVNQEFGLDSVQD